MAALLNEIIAEIVLSQHTTIHIESPLLPGYSHHVYELRTGNHERWCLRIPVDAFAARIAIRGTKLLKELKEKRPTLRVPSVIHSSEQYTLLEFLPGRPLGSWNTRSLSIDRRQLLLDDLARFLFDLWGAALHIPKETG